MKRIRIFLLGLATVLFAGHCFAQGYEYSRFEGSLDYSYARWNPSNFPSRTIPGTTQHFGNGHSLNGGGGTFTYNINSWIGIKADLQGYGTHGTSSFFIPAGATSILPQGGVFGVSGNLFTYTFGPQVTLRAGRWNPYFNALFGGAHSNIYKNLDTAICTAHPIINGATCSVTNTFKNPSNNAFAMVVGGGLDVVITKHFTMRAGEVDYLLTRFSTNLIQTGNQNGLRVVTGFVFTF